MGKIPERAYLEVKLGEAAPEIEMGILVPISIITDEEELLVRVQRIKELPGGGVRCTAAVGDHVFYLYGQAGKWWVAA